MQNLPGKTIPYVLFAMNKVAKAGGKILGEPMEIAAFGMYVSFYVTEGNHVSIMEPAMEMKQKTK